MAKPIIIQEPGKDFIYYSIVIAGAGANGSHFFRCLLQDIRTHFIAQDKSRSYSFGAEILLVDNDKVEQKNLGNQLFDEEDIGEYKVTSLAERYGSHYELEVGTVTEYITSLDMLHKLFVKPALKKTNQWVPILVGMVDNNRSRQLFDEYFHSPEVDTLIYVDAGVEGVHVQEPAAPKSEEHLLVEQSGYSGQIVVGFKYRGEVILQPVARVYPNILEDKSTHFPGASCGAAIINNPQRSATNKLAARLANGVLNNLFHTSGIYQEVIDFNAQFGGSRPTRISDEAIEKFESLKRIPA